MIPLENTFIYMQFSTPGKVDMFAPDTNLEDIIVPAVDQPTAVVVYQNEIDASYKFVLKQKKQFAMNKQRVLRRIQF